MSLLKNLITSPIIKLRFSVSHHVLLDFLVGSKILSAQDKAALRKRMLWTSFNSFVSISVLVAPVFWTISNPATSNLVFLALYPVVALPVANWTNNRENLQLETILDKYVVDQNLQKLKEYAETANKNEELDKVVKNYLEDRSTSN